MDRGRFYEIVETAREGIVPESPSADGESLRTALSNLSDDEVADFVRTFEEELVRLNRWSVRGAGAAASGGMSDDAFHWFRCWLIGKGADAVDTALDDPDGLVAYLDTRMENEPLEYAALEELDERGLPDPRTEDGPRPDDEPEGERIDPDSVEERYPRITAAVTGSGL
ncbi:DUF4240 domain-containing protein [Amnibacterium sp. CER49]|uniref:DUF4240 domain-containing protein n=1 Tax=Amnibacterium sp. CER49 TaxID=3039161 RepID=UPI00244CBC63|nr:DUF4240 domain-containing protein [Amnibacterium sp. CER49]MDH2444251.1 DUF4240 domain-containing protein [Amnibacterium sp. CER49]